MVHAATMAAQPATLAGWCGDAARLQALMASDLSASGGLVGTAAPGHPETSPAASWDHCAKLCSTATTPGLAPALAPTEALRAAGLEPAAPLPMAPESREQSPTPPAQAPPARA
jgi:hypothetical protein